MKKARKIFAIIIALTLLLTLLCACSNESGGAHSHTQEIEESMPYEFIYISNQNGVRFYYDRDTKVVYAYMSETTMTPLYNADGSLRLYNP